MGFRLTENDLFEIIRDTAKLVLEAYGFQDEYLTRIPYPIELAFTDHAIERENQRYITEESVRADLKRCVPMILDDYRSGKLSGKDYFKVINMESCSVSVCSILPGGKRLRKIIVITSYKWDGRINIDKGVVYHIGEESPEYAEAKEWNAEHQDIVADYTDWKRDIPIAKQRRKAEKEYYYRNNTEMPPEKKMELINRTYDNQARIDKNAIHNAMEPGELNAIRDYYKKVDKQPISSKGSANRDLRAMDLWKKRKETGEQ